MMRRPTMFALPALLLLADPTASAAVESPWVSGHASRARLLAGTVEKPGRPAALLAGVEIAMPPGWKTYWRNPGDGGGVPPTFDWSGSENLGRATVLYPAPKRISDKGGDTIGYKGAVVFPVVLEALDSTKPISLRLAFSYGVCRDICIPAEAELALVVPVEGGGAGPELGEALEQVPRQERERRPDDPVLVRSAVELSGAKPRLALEAKFPGGTSDADAFVEGPEGVSLPLPEKAPGAAEGHLRFAVDLSSIDGAELKGATLLVTLVGAKGQSEARVRID
jgi:DsbC/DsbD-like thiol-disulfide interchange protein